MRNFVKRLLTVGFTLAVGLLSVGTAAAQDDSTAAADTATAITDTLNQVGVDPATLMSDFLGIVGPLYLQALITGFVFTVGWIIYGHFKRGARAK